MVNWARVGAYLIILGSIGVLIGSFVQNLELFALQGPLATWLPYTLRIRLTLPAT